MNHVLKSKGYVNVLVAGKHPAPQWLSTVEANHHCAAGIGIWEWASNDKGVEPDVVMACAGDVPTLEALAATSILREKMPKLRVRFVNVVDVMRLCQPDKHPHGISHEVYNSMFGTDNKPVLFNFHAYPHMIEKLIFDRHNRNFKVNGYREEGTITTPFDMCALNHVDRYHLVMDVCNMVENQCPNVDKETCSLAPYVRQDMQSCLIKHQSYITDHGMDMPEVSEWKWDKM